MRATKCKHFKTGNEFKNVKQTIKKSPKHIKAFSVAFAFVLAAICFIIPTTTLAPNVDAFEDSRSAAFSVGGIEAFAIQIADNCIQQPSVPETRETTTVASITEESKATQETTPSQPETTEEITTVAEETCEEAYEQVREAAYTEYEASETEYKSDYLIDISNPDPSYSPKAVALSAYDRDKLERLVMGEAGSLGYTGCALVAQAIRDAMNLSGTTSIDAIISEYQYVGSTSIAPSVDVKNAVSFIFDQNGSAVQHRVLCFYTGTSNWHETQKFVTSCANVRFFDYV